MQKKWMYGMALVLALASLSGCKPSLERILKKVEKNTKAASGMSSDMAMVLEGTIGDSDMSLDVGMGLNLKVETSKTDSMELAHMSGTMTLSFLGQDITSEMESYSLQEGDTIKSYSCTDGEWSYSEDSSDEFAEMAGGISDFSQNVYQNAENWVLAEEKEDKDGVSCYVLNGTVSGGDMQGIADVVDSFIGEETDLSQAEMSITMYVDAKKLLPVSILVDGTDLINKMLAGTDAEGSEISVFTVSMENVTYGDITITIPEEALAAENGSAESVELETEEPETEQTAESPKKGDKPGFASGTTTEGEGTDVDQEGFPVTLVDDENCIIQITGIDGSDAYYYILNVYLENKTDANLTFSCFGGSINGVMISPYMSASVASGKKMNADLEFYKEDVYKSGINDITDIALLMEVYETDNFSGDYLIEQLFHLYPWGEAAAVATERTAGPDDVVLVDNEYLTMIYTGISEDDYLGPVLDFYVVNKTDSFIMVTTDNVSVNGYMLDPYWAENVLPGCRVYSQMSWWEDDLSANNITSPDDITEVEFDVTAYDQEDWSLPNFFEETCVISR